jgi:ribonuclease HI
MTARISQGHEFVERVLVANHSAVVANPLILNYEPESNLRAEDGFRFSASGFVVVYTDGSCLGNGSADPVAGLGVYFGPESRHNVSELLHSPYSPSNNAAEVLAVLRAVEVCKSFSHTFVEIRTDSKFLISCMVRHLPLWRQNGWMTTSKKPVRNRLELQALDDALDGFVVQFTHVKGHGSDVGNEKADFLARWATESARLKAQK